MRLKRGDRVRLRRDAGSARAGDVGVVFGYYRRDGDAYAVDFVGDDTQQVDAEDLEPLEPERRDENEDE